MMYHPIKFGCKKISWYSLAHDVASPYQVWLQRRFRSWWNIVQMNIHWNYLLCDLDLHTTSFHKTVQLMIMCHQTKSAKVSSSWDTLESYVLTIWYFTVTLALKTANQSLWKTLWLMMMQHSTKFGGKRFNCSEINIHWHFEVLLQLWPWTQQSNFSIKHSGLW